ncbi:MAG TPA: DNA repair protein RecN [Pseudomonas sp.]|jgi:DNA repair protein RecN (Recombination protein N)|nr:DNA repair protein RecN [Pseudomonas sp.]MBB52384.1 DNA repair protein RecN [Pseudomonadales bacterium]HCA25550.1 DNA repair protein RecN [Pseudomonas sp.]HCB43414.1 DNA repair protein RecN [Pseudomonas sp.]|tara:strand:- start:1320 stop:2996 length:1677 start_codon:yes stop_codon:yes gene_type:complete
MLVHLAVNNYAIVDNLELDLGGGMSVITGETGAGKSIMLDALALTLGDRADSGAVRPGSDKADILATFDISDIPEARQWLDERDLTQDDEQVILRRVITAEGRSRGYINGSPCPQQDLRALGEMLIDIHSQHEHQSLLKTDTHRRLLDEYAGAGELARQVQLAAQRCRQTEKALLQASRQSEEQSARQQLLAYQLDELDNLSLQDGELEELENEQRQLASADQILHSCQQVINICSENDAGSVLEALTASLQRLDSFKSHSSQLGEASDLIASAQIQIEEAVGELTRYLDHFEADPERQQYVEERLSAIFELARKHRIQPAELPVLQQQLIDELEGQQQQAADAERLQEELTAYQAHYRQLSEKLSAQRSKGAGKLAKAVTQEIQRLGMPGGRIELQLTPLDADTYPVTGLENVEFLVSANPGQPAKPLAKVASGGELSRISLGIQVITAQTSRVPTLVFDEVDVGIGGPTAEIVGQLLRQLGARGQVLTVTHLPQVAAQGHQHLFVRKQQTRNSTRTCIDQLDTDARIQEVARMLGGIDLTDESLAHARKLLSATAD